MTGLHAYSKSQANVRYEACEQNCSGHGFRHLYFVCRVAQVDVDAELVMGSADGAICVCVPFATLTGSSSTSPSTSASARCTPLSKDVCSAVVRVLSQALFVVVGAPASSATVGSLRDCPPGSRFSESLSITTRRHCASV